MGLRAKSITSSKIKDPQKIKRSTSCVEEQKRADALMGLNARKCETHVLRIM